MVSAIVVALKSRDSLSLPHSDVGLFATYDCGIY